MLSKAKQSKAKQSKAKRELRALTNNYFKTFLITLLSLTLLFSISCSNEGTTGGGGGNPANVGDAEFEGTLNNISLVGEGWTEDKVTPMITPFALSILDNKVYAGLTMRGQQLLCPDSSNPNVVEASAEQVTGAGTESETTHTEYIKITLDNAANPTTAKVEYHLKFYCPAYAAAPGMSDTFTAKYEGTFNKVASGS